ncbi:MAG: hypothetical protein IT299_07715 [Dehalococcoidia bacterium]|nr:hypothetical protein [Dehalococcoidia bacterium]
MTIERGTLRAWDSTNYRATVQFAGSLSTTVAAIPTSRAIASAEMVTGRTVAVALFDRHNPADALIVGVY